MEANNEQIINQTEGLKLIRNSKGYNWEIKLLNLDIDKLESINSDMIKRFGAQNE